MLLSSLTLFGALLAAIQVSIFSTIPPASALTASIESSAQQVENGRMAGKQMINRAKDGLFYVNGSINGTSIKFAVDTGASVIVLNSSDAERIGLVSKQTSTHRIRTAAGYSAMKWSKADNLMIAGKKLGTLDVAVMDGGPTVSLLGLNALSRLQRVTLTQDQLIIE